MALCYCKSTRLISIFIIFSQLIAGLGYVIFQALDFGIEEDEERAISPQLERILNYMIQRGE